MASHSAMVLTWLAMGALAGSASAVDYSDYWYCNKLEDFLDCRPYDRRPQLEDIYLQWGKDQGIAGLQGEILPEQRREALDLVYKRMIKECLPEAVVAADAPDAGVQVVVGEPHVVMFAPEGKTSDRDGNIAKLGHLGYSLSVEGRWGQFMFPQVDQLRNGLLVVTVFVGGDTPEGRTYLYYVSDDGGRNWRHYAAYDPATERPACDIALRLPDGEELRGPLETDNRELDVAGLNLKTYDGFYRYGDLPREMQGLRIYSRPANVEQWTEETAYWDPDLLIHARKGSYRQIPSPIMSRHLVPLRDGSLITAVFRHPVMSDIGPDGKFKASREGESHQIWRSYDRARTWTQTGTVPRVSWWPFRPDLSSVRAHLLAFPNGDWVAAYRHNGLYWSGGGPLIISKSSDEGKTWSAPRAIRVPGVNPVGLTLENGIGVFAYQRPGLFLTFCGDGKGDLWGNDVTLVRAWRSQRDENCCANSSLLATGPDRFLLAYTKWDVPDPWGQPRQAVLVQEFIVSRK